MNSEVSNVRIGARCAVIKFFKYSRILLPFGKSSHFGMCCPEAASVGVNVSHSLIIVA